MEKRGREEDRTAQKRKEERGIKEGEEDRNKEDKKGNERRGEERKWKGEGERIEQQKQKVKKETTQTGAMSNKPRTLILLT